MFLRQIMVVASVIGTICLPNLSVWPALPEVGSPGLMETLTRGLQSREAMCDSLEAICTVEKWTSKRELEAGRANQFTKDRELGARSLDVVRFRWSGEKWRVEVLTLVSDGWPHWGFFAPLPVGVAANDYGNSPLRAMGMSDGNYACQVDLRQPSAMIGRRQAGSMYRGVGGMLTRLLLSIDAEAPSEFLTGLKNPVIEGIDVIDTTECYRVVDYRPRVEGQQPGYMTAVWIAPDRGFAPMKFEDLLIPSDKRKGYRHVRLCTDMREVQAGLWLPTRTVSYMYNYRDDDPGIWRWTTVVTVRSWKVNASVEERPFEFELPLGTTVLGGPTAPGIGRYVVGDTKEVLSSFDPDAEPPAIDPARARPLKSSDVVENAWP